MFQPEGIADVKVQRWEKGGYSRTLSSMLLEHADGGSHGEDRGEG